MKTFFRDNGLTIALVTMFLFSVSGMIYSGQAAYNRELQDHGSQAVGLLAYLTTGDFLSALFENWESEFLQMSAYVILTAMLFQRGSAESRDPDNPDRPDDELPSHMRKRNPVLAWLYSYSLGIVLALLFVACFWLPLVGKPRCGERGGTAPRRGGAIAHKLSLGCSTMVRVIPELAVRIHVDGGAGRVVHCPSTQRVARVEARRSAE